MNIGLKRALVALAVTGIAGCGSVSATQTAATRPHRNATAPAGMAPTDLYGIPHPKSSNLRVSCSTKPQHWYDPPEFTVTFTNPTQYQVNVTDQYTVRLNNWNGTSVYVTTPAHLGIPPESYMPFTWPIPGELTYQDGDSIATVVIGCQVTNWR